MPRRSSEPLTPRVRSGPPLSALRCFLLSAITAAALSACGGAPPRTAALASLEERYQEAHDDHPEEALEIVAQAGQTELVGDAANYRRLRYLAADIRAPGAEPEWFYAGIPLLGVGVLGGFFSLLRGLSASFSGCTWTSGCSGGDTDPASVGLGISAGLVVTGGVLAILGLVLHTHDAEREGFDRRRDDVIRSMRDAYRARAVPTR